MTKVSRGLTSIIVQTVLLVATIVAAVAVSLLATAADHRAPAARQPRLPTGGNTTLVTRSLAQLVGQRKERRRNIWVAGQRLVNWDRPYNA
jgi:hypothetical protein